MRIRVQENQDEYDIAIQEYGTIEAVGLVVLANGLNFRKAILPNTMLEINTDEIKVPQVVTAFRVRRYKPNNGGEGSPLPSLDLGDFSLDFNDDFYV